MALKALILMSSVLITLLAGCSSESTPSASSVAAAPPQEDPWYVGGTLHQTYMGQWAVASERNRLATAADIAAAILKDRPGGPRTPDDVRPHAEALRSCIDAAHTEQDRKRAVAEIAAACAVLLGW